MRWYLDRFPPPPPERPRPSTTLYIVTGECGDYYCGCGLGHTVGVCDTLEAAEAAKTHALQVQHTYGKYLYRTYYDPRITTVVLNDLPPLLGDRQ